MKRISKWNLTDYSLYDQDDGGILVYMGTAEECAEWLGVKYDSFTRAIRRGTTILKRYTIGTIKRGINEVREVGHE